MNKLINPEKFLEEIQKELKEWPDATGRHFLNGLVVKGLSKHLKDLPKRMEYNWAVKLLTKENMDGKIQYYNQCLEDCEKI